MKTAKWLMLLGTLSAGINGVGVLFAQPVELPSPTEKVPLPEIKIWNKQPVWSPDGKNIAFLSNKESKDEQVFKFYLINSDGTNLRRFFLPPRLDIVESFCWSPNGKRIAFVPWDSGNNKSSSFLNPFSTRDIYVANTDGSNLKNLTQEKRWNAYNYLCWSPDGTKICYLQEDSQIKIIDTDGKFVYKLTEGATRPVWSPDGKKIAFLKHKVDDTIFTIDIDGKNEQTIKIPTSIFIFRIYWSLQEQGIFVEKHYSVDRINTKEPSEWVPVVNATPSKTDWKLGDPCPPTSEINSALSSNGKEIAFNQEGDIWKTTITLPQEGSLFDNQPLNLTKTEKIKEETPCWSPDGKKIVYVRDEEIWVMNSDGTGQTQLTFEKTKAIEAAIKKQRKEIMARERGVKEALEKK